MLDMSVVKIWINSVNISTVCLCCANVNLREMENGPSEEVPLEVPSGSVMTCFSFTLIKYTLFVCFFVVKLLFIIVSIVCVVSKRIKCFCILNDFLFVIVPGIQCIFWLALYKTPCRICCFFQILYLSCRNH